MRALRDNAGNPLGRSAVVGRRALVWDRAQEAFLPPAIVRAVEEDAVLVQWPDGGSGTFHPTEVMLPAVTPEMVAAGAAALRDSWPAAGDPTAREETRLRSIADAETVLAATVEGKGGL